MSYDLNGTSQWIGNASSSPIANVSTGVTLACWAQPDVVANVLINLSDSVGTNGAIRLIMLTTGTRATSVVSGTNAFADTTTGTPSIGTWGHHCAVYSSAARSSFFNGANKVTTTATSNPTGFTRLQIGARRAASAVDTFFNGRIAEVGIWNVVLSDDEIDSLAKAISCASIRPQNLIFYAPLVREIVDLRANFTLSNNGTATVANHTRIYI